MYSLVPDFYGNDIFEITPQELRLHGIRAVICDIDNTLVPYEIAEPTEEVRAWLSALQAEGIAVAFVSNNHPPRVELFNRSLGLPAFANSGKPRRRCCRRALEAMGVTAAETAIVGDQVFTDVLAGRRAGLCRTYLVKPIRDKKNLFFRFKRWLEIPFLRRYARRVAKAEKKF